MTESTKLRTKTLRFELAVDTPKNREDLENEIRAGLGEGCRIRWEGDTCVAERNRTDEEILRDAGPIGEAFCSLTMHRAEQKDELEKLLKAQAHVVTKRESELAEIEKNLSIYRRVLGLSEDA
jgi:hypothetical protein